MPAVPYPGPADGFFLLQLREEFKTQAAFDVTRNSVYVLSWGSCSAAARDRLGDKVHKTRKSNVKSPWNSLNNFDYCGDRRFNNMDDKFHKYD